MLRSVITIMKRELISYFMSPAAYAVLFMFLLISGYFFYSGMVFYGLASMEASRMAQYMGRQEIDFASIVLRPLFGNMAVLMLMITPLVTMRLFSEEKKHGSIELLFTWPVRDISIVLGKFLAALALLFAAIAATGLYLPVAAASVSVPWWNALTGYIGLFLLAASFASLGLFVSTLTENQIISAVISFGALLMFWVIAWGAGDKTGAFAETLMYISILEHIENFAKGVLDTRDIVYYVSFIFFFLFLTMRSLESRMWRRRG